MKQASSSGEITRTGSTAPFYQNSTTPGTEHNLDHLGLKTRGFYVLDRPDDDMYCFYESPYRHLLDEPQQASCGHRLCKSCIRTLSLTNTESSCNAPDCNTKNGTKDVCKIGETPTPDNQDIKLKIGRLLATCPKVNCAWRGPIGSISEHNIQGQHYPLPVIDDSINFLYLTKLMITNIEEKSFLKTETQKQALRISSLESLKQEHQQSILSLKTEVQELKKEIFKISTKFSELPNQVKTNAAKTNSSYKACVWTIPSFKKRMLEAKAKAGHYITSSPFYTHSNGYKLEAHLYLNGSSTKLQDQYISIYIVVLKGEFDSTLKWPLPATRIWVTLINKKDESKNIIQTTEVNPSDEYFQKPVSKSNTGFGKPKFVPLYEINSDQGFTQNDTIKFEIQLG